MELFRPEKSFFIHSARKAAGAAARLLCAVSAALLVLFVSGAAHAHPMGNFAVCHFAAIRPFPETIKIHYIIDIAEVPTYHELKKLDTDGDKIYTDAEVAAYKGELLGHMLEGLTITVDGEPAEINVAESLLEVRDGLPGLKVLWLESQLEIPVSLEGWPRREVVYNDINYPENMGWKEIKIFGSPGTKILDVSPLSDKDSHALTDYPENERADAPDDTQVTFSFGPGESDNLYALDTGAAEEAKEKELTFVEKVLKRFDIFPYLEKKELSTNAVIVGLIFAFILGCFHAVAPGHGKTLVAAYLVGTKGKFTDALVLGFIVTFTHVAAVIVMFLILLTFWERLNAEVVYAWLGVGSGAIIVGMGAWIFYRNMKGSYIPHVHDEFGRHVNPEDLAKHGHDHHAHDHHDHSLNHDHHNHSHDHHTHDHGNSHSHHEHSHHGHDHHDDHGHDHDHGHPPAPAATAGEREGVKFTDLLTLGITGGIVPCPTAIIILFAAIGLNRLAFGLILMISFSVGLAFVLILIGLMVVGTRNMAESRFSLSESRIVRFIPYISGTLIVLIGLGIVLNGLRAAGIL